MPIRPLRAYSVFKDQSQALLNFAVLVSYAVPAFRIEIQRFKSGELSDIPRPDFFFKSNRSDVDDLLTTEAQYEQQLSSYLLITHFSFFESFVSDVISGMIDFHGGSDEFVSRNEARTRSFMAHSCDEVKKIKRKLQDFDKGSWRDRYRKYSRLLMQENYHFPGELFSAFGVRNLVSKLRKLKAHEIPALLKDAMLIELTSTEVAKYHKIRELRNSIAHGTVTSLTMRDVVEMNKFLRELAIKIADHLTEHFFVIEKYAR
jgi:hypothetical protein